MRAIRINPTRRTVELVEGDVEELVEEQVEPPHGMTDLGPEAGLICCMVGAFGGEARLFWHRRLGDVFGGIAFVVGLDGRHTIASVRPGTLEQAMRAIEFLGCGAECLPRLRQLVARQIEFDSADRSQGEFTLN